MNKSVKWVPTGEVRPPREGEWFRPVGGTRIEQARFDFSCLDEEILRMEIAEEEELECKIQP